MSNDRIDVGIKTPDGKTFALEGPIDGADGTDGYTGSKVARRERATSQETANAIDGSVDARLELCIGKIAE